MAGESSPWAGPQEPVDPEALQRLQPRALPRTRSLQEWVRFSHDNYWQQVLQDKRRCHTASVFTVQRCVQILQQAAERPEHGQGLHRASSDLRDTMKSALNRTASFRSAISRSSSAGAREVLDALREAASVDAAEPQVPSF